MPKAGALQKRVSFALQKGSFGALAPMLDAPMQEEGLDAWQVQKTLCLRKAYTVHANGLQEARSMFGVVHHALF